MFWVSYSTLKSSIPVVVTTWWLTKAILVALWFKGMDFVIFKAIMDPFYKNDCNTQIASSHVQIEAMIS